MVVVVCSFLRIGRQVRTTCGPYVRSVARVVVRVIVGDGDDSTTLTAHIVVAAVSSAAFSVVAACTGIGSGELCKLASALVVGALAAGAATMLVRRRMRGAARGELRALLGAATRQLLAEQARVPAARVLRVLLGSGKSAALASVCVALAALAPELDPAANAALLLRLALRPAARILPGMGVALDLHGAYRDSCDNARFVREFALTAASLCPASLCPASLCPASLCPASLLPAPLPALCA
jgi:hypothetical protein